MKCHLPSELIMRAKNPCLLFEPPVSFLSLSLFTARLLSARCTSRGMIRQLGQRATGFLNELRLDEHEAIDMQEEASIQRPGGKTPLPQCEQVKYSRCKVTSCPPCVWKVRLKRVSTLLTGGSGGRGGRGSG